MTGESLGYAAQIAIDTALPFDASSTWLEVKSETLAKQGQILETGGIRGTRSRPSERTRTGPYTVNGQMTLAVDRLVLDTFLPFILGGSEASDIFALTEVLPEFYVMIDRGAKVYTYSGCKINKGTFKGSSSAPILEMALDIEGETESIGAAGSFPSGMTENTNRPYVFSDGTISLQSSSRDFSQFELVVDNQLIVDRFMNALTRSEILAMDRIVTLGTDHPYDTANTDLYAQALAGAAGSLVFTSAESASDVLTFALANLQYPDKSPTVQSKGETSLPLEGTARSTTSTKELIVTNAHA